LLKRHGWLKSKSFVFISLPSKKRSKENAPEIAAFILTKSGNRAQNKAGVLLLSLLPSFVSAQL